MSSGQAAWGYRTMKVRKNHCCCWCGELILKGDTCHAWEYVDMGISTTRLHPECYNAMQEEIKHDPCHAFEWTPYSYERPKCPI